MPKEKLEIYELQDTVFARINTVVVGDYGEFSKLIWDRHDEDMGDQDSCAKAYTVHTGLHTYIWLEEFTMSVGMLAILVHECVHATLEMFMAIGVEHNKHTDEVFAYYLDSLFQQAVHKLGRDSIVAKEEGVNLNTKKKRKKK